MRPRLIELLRRASGPLAALVVTTAATFAPHAAAAADAAAADVAASPAGQWQGEVTLPGTPLLIEVDLTQANGTWSGDITIPAQNAKDLPLGAIAVDGPAVRFVIAGIPGDPTFAGRLDATSGEIAGTFSQGGQSFPFRLARGNRRAATAGERLAGIEGFLTQALADWQVPGVAVGVVAGGEVVMARGFGKRDVAADLPMTGDTLLPIGSATKAFTTFVLGTLVDEGKLDWRQPVRRYLPGFELHDAYATEHLNAIDLVTHRSGLPRHDLLWYNDQEPSRQELVERLRHLAPSKELREEFQYNNLMYLTAGRLIEVLTGKSWEDAVRERVLAPLGMATTVFSDADAQRQPDWAKPYRLRDDVLGEIPFREVGNMGPAGSISSSAAEMSRWLLLHLGGGEVDGQRLLQTATLLQLHTPQMAIASRPEKPQMAAGAYAMGWFADAYRGHNRLSHGGAIDGFIALVSFLPDDGIGVVVLTNAETPLPTVLTQHLLDRLLGLEAIDWNAEALARRAQGREAEREAEQRKTAVRVAGTRPAHPLGDYAGDYVHPGYGTLRVELAGGALRATYNHIATPLAHWHYETFDGAENKDDPTFEHMKYSFVTDVNGNVAELHVPFEPTVDAIVFARRPDARLYDPAYLRGFAGTYQLGGIELTIEVRGAELTLFVPGQPLYTLEPDLGGWFSLRGIAGYRIRFPAGALELQQPAGVYTAQRKP